MATTQTVVSIASGARARLDTVDDPHHPGQSLEFYVESGAGSWGGPGVTATGSTRGIPVATLSGRSIDLTGAGDDEIWFWATSTAVLIVVQIGV